MYSLTFKPLFLLTFLLGMTPLACYSETLIDTDSKLIMDKSCFTTGLENLKVKFPNITEEDAKQISFYGCSCVYKASQKSLIKAEATDFRNDRNCIYYAVLRNSIRYKNASQGNDNTDSGVLKGCLSSFPHDLSDDSSNADVASFCKCASPLTEKIADEIKPLKLNEDQIYNKLITVINGCQYSI